MDRSSRNWWSMRNDEVPDEVVFAALKSLCKTLIWYGQRKKGFGEEQLETWRTKNRVQEAILLDFYGELELYSLSRCVRDLAVHGHSEEWLRNLTNLSKQMWWLEDIRVELDDWNNWVGGTESRVEAEASEVVASDVEENQNVSDSEDDEFFETHQTVEDLVASNEEVFVDGMAAESRNGTSRNDVVVDRQ